MRVMSKLSIFRVSGGRGFYTVCRCVKPDSGIVVFRIYFDRHLAGPACEYLEPDEAIARAVGFAVMDCTFAKKGGIV